MVYRFLVLSDESDQFRREIQISSHATFLELHDCILDSVGYTKGQITSFFICADDWSKGIEITLIEMDTSSEEDTFVMENTYLDDFITEEKQKLLFVFDYMTERAFFIELCEIITRKNIPHSLVSFSAGEAPLQQIDFKEFESKLSTISTFATGMGEDFYGDTEFDADELNAEGFDLTEGFAEDFEDDRP
ncbi:MAG: plasmid pRiA4b ORF-3 family protein [Tannerellaceae bacterium]|jgi:hypothetical protein|nr:plasmid pRiA4b ORF-3 family protein [Tannerellaceae bacterium]